MKRKRVIVLGLAAVAFLAFYHFYGGSAVPSGQQPMVRLNTSNIASLSDAFNGSANPVRVLVLLSPT
jgi:hypothetical protein